MRYLFIFLLISCSLRAQTTEIDSTQWVHLEDVVYSGQLNPQSVKKSVYEVTVINREQIEQSAALNMADLLNQTLNIQITPDASTGKSGVNMLGFDSEYVKVLVDNVPVINDEGLGNFTDFTQINLSDIQQIEIVEGAMGVEYGSDAVAGVINIITNKNAPKKLQAQLFLQEETIGNEYNLKKEGEGRHIKGLDLRKKITDNLQAGISYNQNIFNGLYNGRKGEKYAENDELRGHEWLPKQQYDGKAFLNYKINSTRFYYKFNYFQEKIQEYDASVALNYQPQTDLNNPTAQDTEFKTERWYHLLNVNGNAWTNAKFDVNLSFQKQDRDALFYTYYILDDRRENENEITYESRKTFYGKALVKQTFSPKWNMQLGAEVNTIDGTQSPLARTNDSSTEFIARELGSYDAFASMDIHVSDQVTVRPGIRALFSSRFDTNLAYALSASYLFGNKWELRAIYGNTPKNPSYEELFTYFVDSNHNIQGNENLNPEMGQSIALHLKKEKKLSKNISLKSKLSASYLHLKDQIELVVTNQQPLEYTYANFDTYTSRGITLSNRIRAKKMSAQLGVSYRGTSYESDGKDVLYAWQGNLLLNYHFPQLKLNFSSNFKYNGAQYSWVYDTETDETVKGKLNAYTWWDLSLKKQLYKHWEVVAGIRNLTDITNVRTTATEDGAHSAGGTTQMLGYGRSYFFKLTYNIQFK